MHSSLILFIALNRKHCICLLHSAKSFQRITVKQKTRSFLWLKRKHTLIPA